MGCFSRATPGAIDGFLRYIPNVVWSVVLFCVRPRRTSRGPRRDGWAGCSAVSPAAGRVGEDPLSRRRQRPGELTNPAGGICGRGERDERPDRSLGKTGDRGLLNGIDSPDAANLTLPRRVPAPIRRPPRRHGKRAENVGLAERCQAHGNHEAARRGLCAARPRGESARRTRRGGAPATPRGGAPATPRGRSRRRGGTVAATRLDGTVAARAQVPEHVAVGQVVAVQPHHYVPSFGMPVAKVAVGAEIKAERVAPR